MTETLDARPRPPLDDIRIVFVEQYGAGPWATMQLADLGAEVIKVEDPAVGGDTANYLPPGPTRGVDTASVFRALCGYDEERLASFARGGAFGGVQLEREVSA